jgi:peptidyl-prolyl cis-trans isomerase SurA
MKKLLLIILMLVVNGAHAQNNISIAAIVNDNIITSNDVMGRINLGLQGANFKPDAKMIEEFKKQALDALVDEEIRLSEARRLGISPTKEEIDEAFANLSKQNSKTPEEFAALLKKFDGVHASLQHQLATQIAWNNVVKRKVRPQIKVSEEDIDAYIAEQAKNPAKIEYQVAEIFLRNTDTNMKLAKQLIQELRSGKQRFSAVARQFSQGLEASKGGLIGWIKQGALEPVLDQTIQNTVTGQISDVITSVRGLHIFLVREKRDILPPDLSSQRYKIKQLIVPVPASAPQEIRTKAMAFARNMHSETKDCKVMDASIKKMNHPLSRDLGEVRLGDLAPALIRAVKDQPENKLTDPVQTADGIVMYMVCGRSTAVEDTIRNDVANTIGAERLNRLQQRYYRDLRSAAYVDIK